MPFQRKMFTLQELQDHFQTSVIDGKWSHLYRSAPGFLGSILEAGRSPMCQERALVRGWSVDECHARLIEGITTFHWALGMSTTKELVGLSQNPVLCSLMDIREPILEECVSDTCVDLQAVLLLVAVREMSEFQQFESRENFMLNVFNELNLCDSLHQEVCCNAIRVDLLKSDTLEGRYWNNA